MEASHRRTLSVVCSRGVKVARRPSRVGDVFLQEACPASFAWQGIQHFTHGQVWRSLHQRGLRQMGKMADSPLHDPRQILELVATLALAIDDPGVVASQSAVSMEWMR
jgi:hypothetical protein